MANRKRNVVVKKVSPEEEQRMKDEAFLNLKPTERLRIHELLRKKIWGERYNKTSLKGLKVTRKKTLD